MLNHFVLSNREFCNVSLGGKVTGFQLTARIPNWRGVPLSLIGDVRVAVSDEKFPMDTLLFRHAGRTYSMTELGQAIDTFWYIRDPLTILVNKPGGLNPGIHTVELGILIRPSYPPRSADKEGVLEGYGYEGWEPYEHQYEDSMWLSAVALTNLRMTLVQ